MVTSPPYWGLRDYSVAGAYCLEPTLEECIERMVEVFREVRRVLRSDGTCWLNLGDSYSASPGQRGSRGARGEDPKFGDRNVRINGPNRRRTSGIKPKDIVGVPWLVAFALQADGWWFRSDIVWHKPNPMPESVRDRPTRAHEFLFLLAQSGAPTYWTHRDGPGSRTKPKADYRYVHRETGEEVVDPLDGWGGGRSPPGAGSTSGAGMTTSTTPRPFESRWRNRASPGSRSLRSGTRKAGRRTIGTE